jgi:ribonuclease BN (tRNA processing enzyme)
VHSLTFLGTGDFFAKERYWNSFVIDGRILVEPSPMVVPHLRKTGHDVAMLEAVLISHFHPDHTFGWPLLLLELMMLERADPVVIVGPPGVEESLEALMRVGGMHDVHRAAHERCDIHYVEAAGDGSLQVAGALRLRAMEVEHLPNLRSFAYILELDGLKLGYSGDTGPCLALDKVAEQVDVLVVECTGPQTGAPKPVHLDTTDIIELQRRFPDVRFVITHVGAGADTASVQHCTVASDLETITL